MEFETLGEEERKLLMQALDIDTSNLKCKYCDEKVEVKSCGIMPPLVKDEATVITCDSPLCITTYLVDLEKYESDQSKKGDVFVKHIQKHLTEHQVVVCKICGKDVETIYKEGSDHNGK